MSVALSQEGAFGFGVQAKQGEYVSPSVWLPAIGDGESIQLRKNYVTLDMADGNDFQSRYYSAGEWADGQIQVPMVPGCITGLLSWAQDRDQDNQGKWASLLVDCVHVQKKITDAKVRRMTLEFIKGKPVICTLDVTALDMTSGTAVAVNMPTPTPYLFRDADFEIAAAGGALEAAAGIESLKIIIDNCVENPAEARHHKGKLASLYNLAGVRCSGEISRDFVDNALYADFEAGQEAAIRVQLTRGASTAVICLPRVLYTASNLGLPGSHEQRIVETVKFIGLGSLDGLTAPIVLS